MRKVPATAVELIKRFEQGPNGGFAAHRYSDPVGYGTIGWGHLLHPGDPLWNAAISAEQADDLLVKDLNAVGVDLWLSLGINVATALNDNQWSALLSFVFNEGIGKFDASTLCHLLLQKNFAAAADEFPKWVYGGKPPKVLTGLVTRRGAERSLFLS